MTEIELFDGTVLEFPEGTSQDVIDRAARQETMSRQGQQQSAQPEPERGFGDMLYENIIGRGEVDTPGERLGELVRGGTAAVARGIADVPALPANLLQLATAGVERATGMDDSAVGRALESLPDTREMFASVPVVGPESEYVAPGTAGEYVSTIGEFAGGAGASAGPRAMLRYGAVPGAVSEAAGQATEGTALEPYARIAGAFFTPIALRSGNKTVQSMFKRASDRPSLETLKGAKTAAYKAVDDAGVKMPASVADDIAERATAAARSSNYVPEVDAQTKAALKVLQNQAGKQLSVSELDNIRQGLWSRYNSAPDEVIIRDMIDIVDDAIQAAPGGGDLMTAARTANSRFKKAELLDKAFQKAEDQAAATGSGGNTVNKFRQSVSRIINNPKQSKFFSKEEIDFMRNFVRGDLPENTMRLIGKLSPSGNGLMMALNIGAIATNPMMAAVTAAGAGAKALSEVSAMKGADALKTMAATGSVPARTPILSQREIVPMLPGLLSQ